MTVSTTTARNVKNPNGSTTSFPFDFSFDVDTDLLVTRVVIATAVETPQVLTTDYTVTGGSGATGTIEMNVAPPGPTLENLVIERATPKTQSTDYQPNDPFPAEVNETALDKLTRIGQEGLDLVNRSVKLKKNSTLAGPTIPDPEVDKVLVGKTTTEFENKSISDLDPTVTALPLAVANGGTNGATVAAAQTNLKIGGTDLDNTFTKTQRWSKGVDVASAAPLVLGTDGNYFDVTGTTGFAAITVPAGTMFMLQFDGALTLTHHATNFNLPGGVNILTVAGDRLIGFATGANTVHVLDFIPVAGSGLRSVQVFTGDDTYTKPTGLKRAKVRLGAGGGGGGGTAATSAGDAAAGGGGGAGGYAEELLQASAIGATETVTVGALGAGGAAGNNNGAAGGTTSFGSLLSATGGGGGIGAATDTTGGAGSSGVGSGGNLNGGGTSAGGGLLVVTDDWARSGVGGSLSPYGTGGEEKVAADSQTFAGNAAVGKSSGGSGAASGASQSAAAGGAGVAGFIIVEEYF